MKSIKKYLNYELIFLKLTVNYYSFHINIWYIHRVCVFVCEREIKDRKRDNSNNNCLTDFTSSTISFNFLWFELWGDLY
jgi:hypothetical protein